MKIADAERRMGSAEEFDRDSALMDLLYHHMLKGYYHVELEEYEEARDRFEFVLSRAKYDIGKVNESTWPDVDLCIRERDCLEELTHLYLVLGDSKNFRSYFEKLIEIERRNHEMWGGDEGIADGEWIDLGKLWSRFAKGYIMLGGEREVVEKAVGRHIECNHEARQTYKAQLLDDEFKYGQDETE